MRDIEKSHVHPRKARLFGMQAELKKFCCTAEGLLLLVLNTNSQHTAAKNGVFIILTTL